MSKEILLFGEFSSGKSAFINMLLGVQLLPERLASTDLPVIRISAGSPTGLWLREPGEKNPRGIDKWSGIPTTWESFEYAEVTVCGHPLLDKGLVLWDTPGINSINPQHKKHLDAFLDARGRRYAEALFFVAGNVTSSSVDFLKKWHNCWPRLTIIVNIKNAASTERERRYLETEIKKMVRKNIGNIPVELVYLGNAFDEFAEAALAKRSGMSDWDVIKKWPDIRIDLSDIFERHQDEVAGEFVFELVASVANEKDEVADYAVLDESDLLELASAGDAKAQTELGERLVSQERYVEGAKWYLKAAQQGWAAAQDCLGDCYSYGDGVEKSEVEAASWYVKAAEQGYANAQDTLGDCYRYGWGVAIDKAMAVELYRKAANQGHAFSLCNLGHCYLSGEGVSIDNAKAHEHFLQAAELGNAEAQNMLGRCYTEGWGVEQNLGEAAKWFRKSAEQGYVWGQYNLGLCLLAGTGVTENKHEAFEWFCKASVQGNAPAKTNLGNCYLNGFGVLENRQAAFEWYSRAAELGDADAQNMLGRCYAEGWGVAVNIVEAVSWYTKAAEQGHSSGVYNLGLCFMEGTGVEVDTAKARSLLKLSADKGNENAIELLSSFENPQTVQETPKSNQTVYQTFQSAFIAANLSGHSGSVNALVFSPDGCYLASAGDDLSIMIWDIRTHRVARVMRGHKKTFWGSLVGAGIESICISHDGTVLISGSLCESTLRIWNLGNGTEIGNLTLPGNISSVCFCSDDSLYAVAPTESDVHVLRRNGAPYRQLDTGFMKTVNCLLFNPRWTNLLAGGYSGWSSGKIDLWDVNTGGLHNSFGNHGGAVNDLAFSPDGVLMASASEDMTIRIWDLSQGAEILRIGWHPAAVKSVKFSADGKTILSCDAAGNIILTSLSGGEQMWVHPGDQRELKALAVSPKGESFATTGEAGIVQIWSLR